MEKKDAATVAIGIVGNGFLVPSVLSLLNMSPGWVILTSAVSILALWKWGHQPKTASFLTAGIAMAFALGTVWYLRKPETPPPAPQVASLSPAPAAQKVDPQGLCFVDFKVWYHDKKVAITIRNQNRNKETVTATLIGRAFTLDNIPSPDNLYEAENITAYPEQKIAAFDSDPISLGRTFPAGTVLPGRVYFAVRYGPTPDNTAVLKVKGRVFIKVLNDRQAIAYWKADPDSTPDCPGAERLVNQPIPADG